MNFEVYMKSLTPKIIFSVYGSIAALSLVN